MLISSVGATTLTWAVPVSLFLIYVVNRLVLLYRLARAPGIRAASIGENPISGAFFFFFF